MRNILIAVSGPSGVGKGTMVKAVMQEREDMALSISCTTRAPRNGEEDGREYFFLTREEFLQKAKGGEFLEYDEHFGNLYGTPKSYVKEKLESKSVILEIDVVGAMNAKRVFQDCILVMVMPPSVEELKSRLTSRNSETKQQIETRLQRLDYELAQAERYDYIIVNDDLRKAVDRLHEIINVEKSK